MITEKQKEARSQGIGSSEIAAICGSDPWRSAYDVWALKTGRVEGCEENEAMRLGTALEPTILNLASVALSEKVVRPSTHFVGCMPYMRANIDGMVGVAKRGSPIVEAKSTGVSEGWGAPMTSEVPERVLLQVTWQMMCASSDLAYVACLAAKFGLSFNLYRVEWDEFLAEELAEKAGRFWRCVETDTPPENSIPSMEVLKSLRRTEAEIQIHEDLFKAEREAKKILAEAEEDYENAKAKLVAALGDAKRGVAGPYSINMTSVSTERFDQRAFKEAHPELASQFVAPSTFTRIDIREKKEKK
jgi:putative phage-type endonuclease